MLIFSAAQSIRRLRRWDECFSASAASWPCFLFAANGTPKQTYGMHQFMVIFTVALGVQHTSFAVAIPNGLNLLHIPMHTRKIY